MLVAFSSLIAALASVEKLFVLYTWAYFKLHPEAAPERRWKHHSRIAEEDCDGGGRGGGGGGAAAAVRSAPRVCVECPVYNDAAVVLRITYG